MVGNTVELIGRLFKVGQMTSREREVLLRVTALIGHLPVPIIFVDARGMDVVLNDRAYALLGITPQDAHPVQVSEALNRLIDGDGYEARRRAMAPEARTSLMFEITAGLQRRHQVETRWINEGDLQGRIWLFRDITAEKAFQTRLTELTSLLELTIENINEAVMLVDADRRILLWNHGCIDLFDLPDTMVDRGADFMNIVRLLTERGDLGPGSLNEIVAESERRIALYGFRGREINRPDGRVIDLRYTPIAGGHFLLTARDITDERQAARFKDELIATVSHELRTPLTAINGSLGLLSGGLAGELSDQAATLIEVAHRNSVRLGRLINDLLDMDKLSSGKLEFRFAETDVGALLAEVVEQNMPYALNFGVGIKLIVPDAQIWAEIDPDRIGQVITNLLSNAAKFSPAGNDVRLRLLDRPDGVRISVSDNGRGMSPEFQRRIFTRFAQEDRSSERGQAGTGLGLAISKSIIDYHGGRISVESIAGEGTRFDVTLPRRRPAS